MVSVVVRFARDVGDHRVAAGHHGSTGGSQRMQVGFERAVLVADVEVGEWLAVDLDGHGLVSVLRDLHLRAQWQCERYQAQNAGHVRHYMISCCVTLLTSWIPANGSPVTRWNSASAAFASASPASSRGFE